MFERDIIKEFQKNLSYLSRVENEVKKYETKNPLTKEYFNALLKEVKQLKNELSSKQFYFESNNVNKKTSEEIRKMKDDIDTRIEKCKVKHVVAILVKSYMSPREMNDVEKEFLYDFCKFWINVSMKGNEKAKQEENSYIGGRYGKSIYPG